MCPGGFLLLWIRGHPSATRTDTHFPYTTRFRSLTIAVYDGNALIAEAGPLLIRGGKHAVYWGDLHGQSGESIGIGASRECFTFARELSFLDVSSHQPNAFQVNNAFWKHLTGLTAEFHQDHRFVTFPSYDRKSVGLGQIVSVRVDHGVRRLIKYKTKPNKK